ncbi:hypothetical protein [Yoonia sp. BS5-3]|uniref:Uncharacterized protein n=1 Tax=Yoonia phaeophyticola TaxID=3137369 RepID=A0ABZ2V271_9RHOB
MIEIGPTTDQQESSFVPDTLHLDLLLARAAGELERMSWIVDELEDNFLTTSKFQPETDKIKALQSVDMLVQSVNALGAFLTELAQGNDPHDVKVGTALSLIPLQDMRERFINGNTG